MSDATLIQSSAARLCLQVPVRSDVHFLEWEELCGNKPTSRTTYTALNNPTNCMETNAGLTHRQYCITHVRCWTAEGPGPWSLTSEGYQCIPEPITPVLLLAGIVGLALLARWKR